MKRFATLVVAFFLVAAPARGHFIWLLPNESDKDKPTARVVFSDGPAPGAAELIKKIDKVAVYSRGLDLKTTELKTTEDKDALQVGGLEKGPQVLGAVLKYGVHQKGTEDPALIHYYAKSYVGENLQKAPPKNLMKPWDKLALEIVPLVDEKNTIQVLWQAKPLAGAEVVLYVPGRTEPVEGVTDKDGLFQVAIPKANGVYGIRALYTEKGNAGEYEGKKYAVVRHYATLTFPVDKFNSK
jgi:uncharacterized GH25 family protein